MTSVFKRIIMQPLTSWMLQQPVVDGCALTKHFKLYLTVRIMLAAR